MFNIKTEEKNNDIMQDIIHDDELINRAKLGDSEAFGELVARHRAKAYGWAKKMTQDTYLAEDIVQEALLQAFLKISALIDSRKFLSWFHRIVKNEGNMKLRRGGIYTKEMPFIGFSSKEKEIDWTNIEDILYQLTKSVYNKPNNNPVEQLIRKETLFGLSSLLQCLTQRERKIFEGYFFEQLSPKEIADLFQMKVSNVYNIISRSRNKLQRERIRVEIKIYVKERKQKGLPTKRVLDGSKLI